MIWIINRYWKCVTDMRRCYHWQEVVLALFYIGLSLHARISSARHDRLLFIRSFILAIATQGTLRTVAASISPFSIINFSVIFTDTLYVFIFILLSIILSIFSIDMMTKSNDNDNDIIQRYCSTIRIWCIYIFSFLSLKAF